MAGSDTTDGGELVTRVSTEEEFQSVLRDVVLAAETNGVDVRGSWPIRGENDEPNWDVEITRISRRSEAEIRDSEFPASSVVEAVANRKGVDQTALPPLYDAIGPDILETIHRADGESRQTVTFEYAGYVVTVDSDGSVVIEE